jgi:hypothetical protein
MHTQWKLFFKIWILIFFQVGAVDGTHARQLLCSWDPSPALVPGDWCVLLQCKPDNECSSTSHVDMKQQILFTVLGS